MQEDRGAPFRHAIDWRNPDFYDRDGLDAEMRRVFDVCHGCRRCFNLCDAFPRLFDLIDESESGELDSVASEGFKGVVDACTLCDMCFMTKCPYVPPHEFNIDFPHLMLRYRAAELKEKGGSFSQKLLGATDRNGRLGRGLAPLMNWASDTRNGFARGLLAMIAGIHREAALPRFHAKTFMNRAAKTAPEVNREAPAYGRKAVLFATCYANYNNPKIGEAARAVLARNGVETEVVYPVCCGMPQLEAGDLGAVAARAETVSRELSPWIDKGFDVIALVPSCALMLKAEWPLVVKDDAAVKRLAEHCFDISEYVVDIACKEGIAEGLRPLDGGVTLHIACHARALNVGHKAADMLGLVPETEVAVIERCAGHGGAWGVRKEFFEVALKVGRPVARQALGNAKHFVASECPLAAAHIIQGMERQVAQAEGGLPAEGRAHHPIELLARAYGVAA